MKINITVNDMNYEREIKENLTLLRFLREEIGLTGTKEGCGAGECGACTVILNGRAVNSCLVLAAQADGGEVFTIESEGKDGELSELQKSFQKHHAVQCGFCTPGMTMSVKALLMDNPEPTEEDIYHAIEGNFCRCTGYKQIAEAVLDYTGKMVTEDMKYV